MPEHRDHDFAERNGPTVLLGVGVLMILAAVAAIFTGHEVVAGGVAVPGVLAALIGAVLSRMEGPFSFLGMSGNLRPLETPADDLRVTRQLAPGESQSRSEAIPMVPVPPGIEE